jgi:hypothetical protein
MDFSKMHILCIGMAKRDHFLSAGKLKTRTYVRSA